MSKNNKTRVSRVDRFLEWAANHRVVSVLIISGVILAGVAQFGESASTLWKLVTGSGNEPELADTRVLSSEAEMEDVKNTLRSADPEGRTPVWWREDGPGDEAFDFIVRNPGTSDVVITRLNLRAQRQRRYEGDDVVCFSAVPSWGYDVALDPGDLVQSRSVKLAQVVPAGKVDRFVVFLGHAKHGLSGAIYQIEGELVTSSGRQLPFGTHEVHVQPHECSSPKKRDAVMQIRIP